MTGKEVTFDLAKFFNMETAERITTLASPDMIVGRLNRLLAYNNDHDQFSGKITIRMNAETIQDSSVGAKSEHHSPYSIA